MIINKVTNRKYKLKKITCASCWALLRSSDGKLSANPSCVKYTCLSSSRQGGLLDGSGLRVAARRARAGALLEGRRRLKERPAPPPPGPPPPFSKAARSWGLLDRSWCWRGDSLPVQICQFKYVVDLKVINDEILVWCCTKINIKIGRIKMFK